MLYFKLCSINLSLIQLNGKYFIIIFYRYLFYINQKQIKNYLKYNNTMVLNYFSNFYRFEITFYKFRMLFFLLLVHNSILLNIFILFCTSIFLF